MNGRTPRWSRARASVAVILLCAAATATATATATTAAAAAVARPWPDDPASLVRVGLAHEGLGPGAASGRPAQLRRVGTQFVRGDDLTGAGVAAPGWITELVGTA